MKKISKCSDDKNYFCFNLKGLEAKNNREKNIDLSQINTIFFHNFFTLATKTLYLQLISVSKYSGYTNLFKTVKRRDVRKKVIFQAPLQLNIIIVLFLFFYTD